MRLFNILYAQKVTNFLRASKNIMQTRCWVELRLDKMTEMHFCPISLFMEFVSVFFRNENSTNSCFFSIDTNWRAGNPNALHCRHMNVFVLCQELRCCGVKKFVCSLSWITRQDLARNDSLCGINALNWLKLSILNSISSFISPQFRIHHSYTIKYSVRPQLYRYKHYLWTMNTYLASASNIGFDQCTNQSIIGFPYSDENTFK